MSSSDIVPIFPWLLLLLLISGAGPHKSHSLLMFLEAQKVISYSLCENTTFSEILISYTSVCDIVPGRKKNLSMKKGDVGIAKL